MGQQDDQNACKIYRAGQKMGPLRLTVHIFIMPEPICVIFGMLKHCVVLNTSIKSMLKKSVK